MKIIKKIKNIIKIIQIRIIYNVDEFSSKLNKIVIKRLNIFYINMKYLSKHY